MTQRSSLSVAIILCAVILESFVWNQIIFHRPFMQSRVHFLDVGQGDSELLELPGGVRMITDAGPDASVISALEHVMPASRKYIDVAFISHPQLDHYNGFNSILERYGLGAILLTGRDADNNDPAWAHLKASAKQKHIPLIPIMAGDRVLSGKTTIEILSPDSNYIQSGELNDTSVIERILTPEFTALFTGDIDAPLEEYLARNHNIAADILKVSHHGSRFSSSPIFLAKVDPKVTAIEVGAKNHYGHPGKETLERIGLLASTHLFRTDLNGTITVTAKDGTLQVYTER